MHQLNGKRILVTGGAGFIGSNLVEQLLAYGAHVTVLDNLETGSKENIEDFFGNPLFEFIEGDITNEDDCKKAVANIDIISHQAALGSVPRSIALPHATHAANATGFLNMLHAAKEAGIKRFVFASSSSVYGDSTTSPKTIGSEGNLLSPYAVTKHLNEEYAKVYTRLHGMEMIGLRYFNVFGPKQNPNGVYAAAIPKFIDAMMNGNEIIVNGDGEQTRDFTYVRNAVEANVNGLMTDNLNAFGKMYNVACGDSFTLNNVLETLKIELQNINLYNHSCQITYGPERTGDIKHSLADISETADLLNYTGQYSFSKGIKEYLDYLAQSNK